MYKWWLNATHFSSNTLSFSLSSYLSSFYYFISFSVQILLQANSSWRLWFIQSGYNILKNALEENIGLRRNTIVVGHSTKDIALTSITSHLGVEFSFAGFCKKWKVRICNEICFELLNILLFSFLLFMEMINILNIKSFQYFTIVCWQYPFMNSQSSKLLHGNDIEIGNYILNRYYTWYS